SSISQASPESTASAAPSKPQPQPICLSGSSAMLPRINRQRASCALSNSRDRSIWGRLGIVSQLLDLVEQGVGHFVADAGHERFQARRRGRGQVWNQTGKPVDVVSDTGLAMFVECRD